MKLLVFFSFLKSSKKHDYIQLLLEAKADKINLDFDNKQYDSGNMKIVEKKMTRKV